MGLPAIKLLVIRSANVDRAVGFYRCLGIEFSQEQHGKGPVHFAADLGEMIFEIYPAVTEDVDNSTRLGFSVSDLTGAMEQFKDAEAEVIQAPRETPWGTRALLRDPDGRVIEVSPGGHSGPNQSFGGDLSGTMR